MSVRNENIECICVSNDCPKTMMECTTEFHQTFILMLKWLNPENITKAILMQIGIATAIYLPYCWTEPTVVTMVSGLVVILLLLEKVLPFLNGRLPELEEKDEEKIYKICRSVTKNGSKLKGLVMKSLEARVS